MLDRTDSAASNLFADGLTLSQWWTGIRQRQRLS